MNSLDKIARRILRLEREVRHLGSTPQLANSSVEDGSLVWNQDGTTTIIVGAQQDGTNAPVVVSGPPPPAPAGVSTDTLIGGILAIWDGSFVDDVPSPMDFGRVEIHVSTIGPEFVPDLVGSGSTTLKGSFSSVRGGKYAVQGLADADHWVKYVTRSLPGKWSDSSITLGPIRPDKVTAIDLEDRSVTTTKIADAAVTANELAEAAVTSTKLAPLAVDSTKIADFSVLVTKLRTTNHQIY